jgi:hypothetical protein
MNSSRRTHPCKCGTSKKLCLTLDCDCPTAESSCSECLSCFYSFIFPVQRGPFFCRTLSPSFPNSAPILQVKYWFLPYCHDSHTCNKIMSQARHPWLSTDGYCRVTGFQALNNWTPASNLGTIGELLRLSVWLPSSYHHTVSDAMTEFCSRPPTLLAGPQQGQGQAQQGQDRPLQTSQAPHQQQAVSGVFTALPRAHP